MASNKEIIGVIVGIALIAGAGMAGAAYTTGITIVGGIIAAVGIKGLLKI